MVPSKLVFVINLCNLSVMKQAVITLLAAFAVGCGHLTVKDDKGTVVDVQTQDGKMTFKDDKGTVTSIDSKSDGKGNVTITAHDGKETYDYGKAVTEADLGVPFYPGSQESKTDAHMATAEQTVVVSTRTTTDDPSKVLEFYKDKVKTDAPGAATISTNEMATVSGKLADGGTITIIASKNTSDKLTTIQVSVTKKK